MHSAMHAVGADPPLSPPADDDDAAAAIRPLHADTAQRMRSSLLLLDPAAAAHELVANALDAGARRIDIVVDFCGLAPTITVRDDGGGMTLDDLRMIGQRHATSKWSADSGRRTRSGGTNGPQLNSKSRTQRRGSSMDDLTAASARSLGWRGEALSSLAQIGVLEIQTRPRAKVAQAQSQLRHADPQHDQSRNHAAPQRDAKRRRVDSLHALASNAFAAAGGSFSSSSSAAAAGATPTAAAAAPSAPSGTYSKLIRHGAEVFCGHATAHRSACGSTISVSELFAALPVRAALLREPRAQTREREKLRRRLMRLALIHPAVEFALYDAKVTVPPARLDQTRPRTRGGGAAHSAQQQPPPHVTSKHYFPDSSAAAASVSAAAAPSSATAATTTHLPVIPSQRIWYKPPTATLLDNFRAIFGSGSSAAGGGGSGGGRGGGGKGGAASAATLAFLAAANNNSDGGDDGDLSGGRISPSLSPTPPVSSPRALFPLSHPSLPASLVALAPFRPQAAPPTTDLAAAVLRSMRVVGFLSDPARLLLPHRDLQFVFVNRQFVAHRPINRIVDEMFQRLARFIAPAGPGAGAAAELDASPDAKIRRGSGGGSSALQRGSIKQKGGGGGGSDSVGPAPSPARQGRPRQPAYLLHVELAAQHCDLLFGPDKAGVQFASAWAVADGVTQALRHWLFGLYPHLAAFDRSIFPPTYVPQWLGRSADADAEAAEQADPATAIYSSSAALLSGRSWAAAMSSSPCKPLQMPPPAQRQQQQQQQEQDQQEEEEAKEECGFAPIAADRFTSSAAANAAHSAAPGKRSAASFTQRPCSSASAAATAPAQLQQQPQEQHSHRRIASSSASFMASSTAGTLPAAPHAQTRSATIADPGPPVPPLQPQRLSFAEHSAPAFSASASALSSSAATRAAPRPTFRSSFAHGAAKAPGPRASRAPAAFLTRAAAPSAASVASPAPRPGRQQSSIISHASRSAARAASPPRLRSHLQRSDSRTRASVLEIARGAIGSGGTGCGDGGPLGELEEPQRWSSAAPAPMAVDAAPWEEENHGAIDASTEWTNGRSGKGAEDGAAVPDLFAPSLRAAPTALSDSRLIRLSAPSKERRGVAAGEAADAAALQLLFADSAEFQGFAFSSPQPMPMPMLRGADRSVASPAKAQLKQEQLKLDFVRTPPRVKEEEDPSSDKEMQADQSFPFAADGPAVDARQIRAHAQQHAVDDHAGPCPCGSATHSPRDYQPAAADLASTAAAVPTARFVPLDPHSVVGREVAAGILSAPRPPSPSDRSPSPPPLSALGDLGAGASASSLLPRSVQLHRSLLRSCTVIGQLDRKFIVVHSAQAALIVAVDQHAADERRRLEFLQAHADRFVRPVPLLRPVAVPVSAAEEAVLRDHGTELAAWGFRYRFPQQTGQDHSGQQSGPQQPESFVADGPSASLGALPAGRVLLLSVPLVCGVELDIDDFREAVQRLRPMGPLPAPAVTAAAAGSAANGPAASEASHLPAAVGGSLSSHYGRRTPPCVQRVFNYKACRSAVMFGDSLRPAAMRAILTGLSRCDFPFSCAHGRPTMTPLVHVQTLDENQRPEESGSLQPPQAWSPAHMSALLGCLSTAV